MTDNSKGAENIIRIYSISIPAIFLPFNIWPTSTKMKAPTGHCNLPRRLISLQPGKAAHYRSMAEIFRRRERKDSALLYYSKAYKLAPKDYINGIGLGDILIGDKMFLRADSIIQAGLENDSINIPFLQIWIRSAYEAEDYKTVLLPGERLIRLQEPSLNSLTMVFYRTTNKNCIPIVSVFAIFYWTIIF